MPPPPDERSAGGGTRATPVLLLAIAAILLVARIALGIWEEGHPRDARDRVAWVPIEAAEGEALRTHKAILYDFSADWCPPCRKMQREVFADSKSAEIIGREFVPVRVLDRRREEGKNSPVVDALQGRFGVTAFPTLVVVTPEGREPVVLSGYDGKDSTILSLTRARMKMAGPGRLSR